MRTSSTNLGPDAFSNFCRPSRWLSVQLTLQTFHSNTPAVVVLYGTDCYFPSQHLVTMMTNMRSNRNKAHLGLGALLIALCLVSWLVLLAGIAAVQKTGQYTRVFTCQLARCFALFSCSLCYNFSQSALDIRCTVDQPVTVALNIDGKPDAAVKDVDQSGGGDSSNAVAFEWWVSELSHDLPRSFSALDLFKMP